MGGGGGGGCACKNKIIFFGWGYLAFFSFLLGYPRLDPGVCGRGLRLGSRFIRVYL